MEMSKHNSVEIIYGYPNHTTVKEIVLCEGQYNSYTDCQHNTITVKYYDKECTIWTSSIVTQFGGPLVLDALGELLFGCSLKGVYCCRINTGEIVWKSRKFANQIVLNANNTLTCAGLSSIFVLTFTGEIINELKTRQEDKIEYLGDNYFLIGMTSKKWNIVEATTLSPIYEIPSDAFWSFRLWT